MAAKVLKFKMWPSDDEEAGSKVCSTMFTCIEASHLFYRGNGNRMFKI